MKKSFILSAIASLLLVSCSNDDAFTGLAEDSVKQIPVSLNIASGNELQSMRATSSDRVGIKSLTYLVFKESDKSFVKSKSIMSGDLSSIQDTLPQGRYIISVLGSTDPAANLYPQCFSYEPNKYTNLSFYLTNKQSLADDLFYGDFTIDVKSENVTYPSVELKKFTTKVEIVLLDESIPAGVSNVKFYFNRLERQTVFLDDLDKFVESGAWGDLATAISPTSSEYTSRISNYLGREVSAAELAQNRTVSLHVIPMSSQISGRTTQYRRDDIEAQYELNGQVYTKSLNAGYELYADETYRISGYLFSGDEDSEWSVE